MQRFFRRWLSISLVAVPGVCGFLASTLAQPAGSLDAGFILTDPIGDRVNAVAIQPDGDIVIGGTFIEIAGLSRDLVARVHFDGTLDDSFVPPAIESYNTLTDKIVTTINSAYIPLVFSTAVQSDGKVLVGGSFYFLNGKPGYGGLTRLNPDGSIDSTFNSPRFNGTVFSIVVLDTGKILVGGDYSYAGDRHHNCLVRLDSSGQLDDSFDPGLFQGTVPQSSSAPVSRFPTVHTIAIGPNGGIIIGGIFTSIGGTPRRGIARLGANGRVDGGFVPDASFDPVSSSSGSGFSIDQVLSVVVQADGKVVTGGNFVDPTKLLPANSVFRLNDDGSLDQSFNPGGLGTYHVYKNPPVNGGSENGIVYALALQPDGKILVGGDLLFYNNVPETLVARLNSDGTLDTTFSDGVGPDSTAFCLTVQPNGQVLVGGAFNVEDGVPRPRVARLNTVANVPPAVLARIEATSKDAIKATRQRGAFTITRTGTNQTADLFVNYTTSGTAVAGVDYKQLSGQLIAPTGGLEASGTFVIPGGSSSATFRVKALTDMDHANKKLTVTLVPTAAYGLSKSAASVIIIETP